MAVQQEKSTTTIDDLNDDCLMHIFQYLPFPDRRLIEGVSKRWEAASNASWCFYSKRLEVNNDLYSIATNESSESKKPDELIEILQSLLHDRGPFLKEIFFAPEVKSKLPPGTLATIIPMCPNLTKLQAEYLEVGPEDIDVIIRQFKELESLGLGRGSVFTEQQFDQIMAKNPRLRYLRIDGASNYIGSGIEGIKFTLYSEAKSGSATTPEMRDLLRKIKKRLRSQLRKEVHCIVQAAKEMAARRKK